MGSSSVLCLSFVSVMYSVFLWLSRGISGKLASFLTIRNSGRSACGECLAGRTRVVEMLANAGAVVGNSWNIWPIVRKSGSGLTFFQFFINVPWEFPQLDAGVGLCTPPRLCSVTWGADRATDGRGRCRRRSDAGGGEHGNARLGTNEGTKKTAKRRRTDGRTRTAT